MTAIKSARCAVCWASASNGHHEPPKSHVGDHDDTITLCGAGNASGCHGLAHNNGGSLRLFPGDSEWHFTCDTKAARAINARRKRTALPAVKPTLRYAVIPIERTEHMDELADADTSLSDLLAASTAAFSARDNTLAVQWRECAEIVATTYDALHDALGREAVAVYQDWVTVTLGLSKSRASKMRTVTRWLGEHGKTLPADVQYHAARAVKLGRVTAAQAAAELEAGTLHDFMERHDLAAKRERKEPMLVCSECGCMKPQSEYERVSADDDVG